MPRYNLELSLTAANINVARKTALASLESAFGAGVTSRIAKVNPSPSRADRLDAVVILIADALSEVESLHEEIEAWKEGLPENLQSGSKADELEECLSQLDELKNSLDEADSACRNVSFPGMY